MTCVRPGRQHRRAFWLIEIMAVIGLFAAFGMIAVAVFRISTRATFTSSQTLEAAQRFDQTMRLLRGDVLASSAIKADGSSVELTTGSGIVTWRIQPDGWLIRRQGAGESKWERMPAGLRFETGAARLIVTAPSGDGADEQLTLVSTLMLAREGK